MRRNCPVCGSERLMVLDDGAICPDCKKLYMVRNPIVSQQAVAVREFQERREKAFAALLAAAEAVLEAEPAHADWCLWWPKNRAPTDAGGDCPCNCYLDALRVAVAAARGEA